MLLFFMCIKVYKRRRYKAIRRTHHFVMKYYFEKRFFLKTRQHALIFPPAYRTGGRHNSSPRGPLPKKCRTFSFLSLVPWPLTFDPKFALGRDFCIMHLTTKFIILRLIVRKLSCWQTNRLTNKQTPLKTSTSLRFGNNTVTYSATFCIHFAAYQLFRITGHM